MGNEEQELTKEQIWNYDHAEIFGVIALSADGNNIEGYEKDFSGHEQFCLLIPPTNLAILDELGLDIGFDTLLY